MGSDKISGMILLVCLYAAGVGVIAAWFGPIAATAVLALTAFALVVRDIVRCHRAPRPKGPTAL